VVLDSPRDPVTPLLKYYGSVASASMLRFLPSADPKTDVQKYLYDPLGEYPRRQGKLIRPCLCMAASCAFGGTFLNALNTAVAIELFHNATLIHDDFQDGAMTRREAPALHEKYGPDLAINAGDALFLLALRPLLSNFDTLGVSLAAKLLTEFDWASWQTVEGQAMELGWRYDNRIDTSISEYFTMAMKKTAWLGMILPIRAGVLIASGGSVDPNTVVPFGFHLGCLFQIVNDIANIADSGAHLGRGTSDILEGKRSLIIMHTINRSTLREKEEISFILRQHQRGERSLQNIERIHELITKYDALQFARATADVMAEAAQHAFQQTFGNLDASPDKDFIYGLIGYFRSLDEVNSGPRVAAR
jgi:geranylgeranyl diphosphate synthase type II